MEDNKVMDVKVVHLSDWDEDHGMHFLLFAGVFHDEEKYNAYIQKMKDRGWKDSLIIVTVIELDEGKFLD